MKASLNHQIIRAKRVVNRLYKKLVKARISAEKSHESYMNGSFGELPKLKEYRYLAYTKKSEVVKEYLATATSRTVFLMFLC